VNGVTPPAPRAKPLRSSSAALAIRHPFFWLATVVLLVAIADRAKEVLIPLTLSVVVAFALTPAVTKLERHIGRALSVALVVLLALGAVSGFGLLLKRQLGDLANQMTRYSESMRRKVASLRGAPGGLVGLSKTVDKVVLELDERVAENRDARPVRIVPAEASAFDRITATLEPLLKPLGSAVIVLVLVIFLLGRREDLRDRFIRLAGRRNVTLTTRALDDAGDRISRFLVVQSAINGAFGALATIGLLMIGVPYAPLWGVVAAVLRFIPFVGTMLGMLLPTVLAFAQLEGWWPMLETMALFTGLDLVAAYAVEPLAVGRQTGVSSLAMVVMAIFWTWLWGLPGLVLSTPLTVCLAVLGHRVPRLEFLAIILGDDPPLEPELVFYQRLLARDDDEAAAILERSPAGEAPEVVLDTLVVPALLLAEQDHARGEIGDPDHQEILRTMRALVGGPSGEDGPPPEVDPAASVLPRPRILGVAAQTVADDLLWEMLARVLDPARFTVRSVGAEALASEVTAASEIDAPHLVCITSCPPGGLSHVRYLCKRLRRKRSDLPIVVLRPGTAPETSALVKALAAEGVARVVFTLAEARVAVEQLALLMPVSGVGAVPRAPVVPVISVVPQVAAIGASKV
jgi:predicted PurR-regulated permease PerM